MSKTYIIAECGCEHCGNLSNAKYMIDMAKEAGADCVKFQLFFYYEVGKKMWNKISRFFLDVNTIAFLKHYAEKQGLDFLCSAFGKGSLTELAVMGCKTVKVPAPCNEWDDYFYIARAEFSNLIISSGMTDKRSSLWRENDKILLCTSSYPCPYDQVNLNTLHDYDGISDHTKGIHIATAAVALGAQIVEKHMTIPWYNGPDKDASINPDEFKDMVTQIRQIEQAMGDGKHKVEECERKLTWRKRYV